MLFILNIETPKSFLFHHLKTTPWALSRRWLHSSFLLANLLRLITCFPSFFSHPTSFLMPLKSLQLTKQRNEKNRENELKFLFPVVPRRSSGEHTRDGSESSQFYYNIHRISAELDRCEQSKFQIAQFGNRASSTSISTASYRRSLRESMSRFAQFHPEPAAESHSEISGQSWSPLYSVR